MDTVTHLLRVSMSTLPQQKCPARALDHFAQCHLPRRVLCAATTTNTTTAPTATTKNKPTPVRLAIAPPHVEPPALVTPPRKPPSHDDPSLQSTWFHRAWVATGCTTVLISLAKAIVGSADSHFRLEPMLAGYIGYILADLGSGIYHWGIDNYGDASTPIFGSQIEAFQGHHKWPWTITRRQFANNLHALARAVTVSVLPIDIVCADPVVHGFVGVCSGCIMFSQQLHAWAHSTKSKLPAPVAALQDAGFLVSRSQHAAHHQPPYNNNYCIVSGVWNKLLDKHKVFGALEMALYFRLGVRPRSWSEPSSEWIEEVEQQSQAAVH